MRNPRIVVAFVLVALSSYAFADPGAAINEARQLMQQNRFDAAIQKLSDAIPDAVMLPEPQRAQALAAIHFYTAGAFFGLANDAKTREELEQFFHFSPSTSTIDPKRYAADFVKMFNEVHASLKTEDTSNFDSVYPGWRAFGGEQPKARPVSEWGDGPALAVLGTAEEKRQWKNLRDDDARRTFIEAFWKQRDKSRDTEANEFRADFEKREAFADHAWPSEKQRGSMSDRGRVFLLLGPPRVIRIKPLSAREGGTQFVRTAVQPGATTDPNYKNNWQAMDASDRSLSSLRSTIPIAKGGVERWIFAKEQLPPTVPNMDVVFKFITEEGYGDHILQRDFLVTKALHDAALQ